MSKKNTKKNADIEAVAEVASEETLNVAAVAEEETPTVVPADETTADQLTALYTAFADKYPDDTLTPQFLFKAAEVQSNVLHTDEAVALYDRIINDYPDFEDLPICYFLKGIAYESDSQFEKARQAYQTFVDKYPDHYMADQTRKMIPLVGKSTEEMLDDILAAANDTIIAR